MARLASARGLLLVLLSILLGSCVRAPAPSPSKPAARHAVLLLSADLRGYLEPCGCSENMRGGVARTAALVAKVRASGIPVLYVDAGDTLFAPGARSPQDAVQAKLQAKAVARALEAMRVSLHGVGPLDLAGGEDFERGLGLPDLRPGETRVLQLGGHAVGFVAGADAKTLAEGARALRAKGAEFVVGFDLGPLSQAQEVASDPRLSLDLLVAAHGTPDSGEENHLVSTRIPLVELQSKGRSLLRVDLLFPTQEPGANGKLPLLPNPEDRARQAKILGERITLLGRAADLPGASKARIDVLEKKIAELVQRRARLLNGAPNDGAGKRGFTVRFVPIEATLPKDPEVASLVSAFDRDADAANLAWAKAHPVACPAPPKGQASYVGNAACEDCHADAFAVYEKTRHARAYADLKAAGKAFHVDCVRCHVTGYGRPGGACRVDAVKGFVNVGCESCHGPGSLHVDDPSDQNIRAKPTAAVCVTCHDRLNSPHFDFALYLPHILGKGHGEPSK